MLIIISIKDFEIKGSASKFIPLGMDIIIVDRVGKIKFIIVTPVQRRALVLGSYIRISPLKIWLNIMHSAKVSYS
jgi:hypothetical protein